MKNGRVLQQKLANSELYKELNGATERLRDSHEYDFLDSEDRRIAILCHAIEESARGRDGTSVPYYGIIQTIFKLGRESHTVE